MKILKKILAGAGVTVFVLGTLTLCAAEGDARGPGQDHGRRGQGMKKLRSFVETNLPGAKEEFERHKQALEAIREEIKAFGQQVKAAVQAEEGEQAKRAVLEDKKQDLAKYAAKIVDERLRHAEKMLELRKANRDKAVEMTTQMILARAAKKHGHGQARQGHKPMERAAE